MRSAVLAPVIPFVMCALVVAMGFASLPRDDGRAINQVRADMLIVPVQGVARSELTDSWGAPRDGGRSHKGVDIMAPMNTPVVAAADGVIAKLHRSARGGLAIYQTNRSGGHVLYYAHLSRYAPDLKEGDAVRQGEVIGFVGQTGNASTPHLHFELQRLDEDDAWRGKAVNAYAYLRLGAALPE